MRAFPLCLVACLVAQPALAKPLLSDTQDSFAKACIDFNETSAKTIEICQQALTGDGFSPSQKLKMMENLGSAHLYLDQLARAEQVFTQILIEDPEHSGALNGMGWVHRERSDYALAVGAFEKAILSSPSAEALGGLTASRFDAGQIDLETALAGLDASLAIDPDYRWTMREKGWVLRDADRFEEAEAMFRRALAIYKKDTNALFGLARTLRNQKRYDVALEQINAALDIEAKKSSFLAERSLIFYFLDQNKQALNDAERVIALDPDWVTGYVRKARALADLGQRDKAIALLEAQDARLGVNGFLIYWLADLLADDGRFTDSVTQIERLVAADLAGSGEMHLLAYSQLGRRDIQGARWAVDQALELAPNDPYSIYYDALVLLEEGAIDKAEEQIIASVTAGLPENRSAYFLGLLAKNHEYVRMIRLRIKFDAMSDG